MIATGGKGAIVDREGPGGPKWSTPWVCIHPSILPQAEAPVEPWEVPVDAVVGGSREEEARGGGPGEEAPPPEALVEERRGFVPAFRVTSSASEGPSPSPSSPSARRLYSHSPTSPAPLTLLEARLRIDHVSGVRTI